MYNIMSVLCLCTADNNGYSPSSENSSRSERALSLQDLSNVAESGLWVFRVDGATIQSGGMCVHMCTSVCVCIHSYICLFVWAMVGWVTSPFLIS